MSNKEKIIAEILKEGTSSVPDFIFNFGKYKGYSLEEIFCENPGYLRWIHDNASSGLPLEVQKFLFSNFGG